MDYLEIREKFSLIMGFYHNNQKTYDEICERFQMKEIVPFVGAGMSVPIYKTVDEALQELAEMQNVKIPKEYVLYEDKLSYLIETGSKELYINNLMDLYDYAKITSNEEMLGNMAISRLPYIIENGIILTSNFDMLIEYIYKKHGDSLLRTTFLNESEIITERLRNRNQKKNQPILIKIHGDIGNAEETIVFDKEAYNRMYSKGSVSVRNLERVLGVSVCLFLGCSLAHDRFLELLKKVSTPGVKNYAIYPSGKSDVDKTTIINRLTESRIFPIIYPEDNHDCVKVLMEYLAYGGYPQFEYVDSFFVENRLVEKESEHYQEVIQQYHKMGCSYDAIMNAVCNGICNEDEEMLEMMYRVSMSKMTPTFIVAGILSGKTTTLCMLLKNACNNNVPAFFIDALEVCDISRVVYELEDIIDLNTTKLICVDNVSSNMDFLDELYRFVKTKNLSKTHFVFSAKLDELYRILNYENGYNEWRDNAVAFYLLDNENELNKYKQGTMGFFHSRNVIKYMTNQYIIREQMSGAENCDIDIYENNYEDDWIRKTKEIDKYCSRVLISECYKYVAALQVYNICIPLKSMITIICKDDYLSGIEDLVYSVLLDVSSVQSEGLISDKEISFVHKIIAFKFFENDIRKLHNVLMEMIENEIIDADLAVLFEKKVFSAKILSNLSETEDMLCYRIGELFYTFCKNSKYCDAVVRAGRAYSLATARVLLDSTNENKVGEIIDGAFRETDVEPKKKNIIWVKLFGLALDYSDVFPEALIEYVDKYNYRQLTDLMQKYKNSSWLQDINNSEKSKLHSFLEIFYLKIRSIDASDVPAILELGEICEARGEYGKQAFLYQEELNEADLKCEYLNLLSKYLFVIDNHFSEKASLEYEKWGKILFEKANSKEKRLRESDVSEQYRRFYSVIESMYVLFLKKNKEFEKAFSVAFKMPEDYPQLYRKYMVLGYLYQDYDYKNRFRDLKKTVECLEKSYNYLRNEENMDRCTCLSVLRPLMNTYYALKDKENAIRIGKEILKYEPKKKRERIKKEYNNLIDQIDEVKYYESNDICFLYKCIDDVSIEVVSCKDTEADEIRIPRVIDNKEIVCLGSSCFEENGRVKKIELPDTLICIKDHAFSGCRKLDTINIPENCTYIGSYAFQWCKSLKQLKLPENLSAIMDSTFISCFNLENIALPKHLRVIGNRAFMNCENVLLDIPDDIREIKKEAFVGCKVEKIKYNGDLKAEYIYEWPYGEAINHVELGEGKVVGVSFREKDVFEISVRFKDNENRVFLFPDVGDNPFSFFDEVNQGKMDKMIKRRTKKLYKKEE